MKSYSQKAQEYIDDREARIKRFERNGSCATPVPQGFVVAKEDKVALLFWRKCKETER